jgi:hypothetical protein
VLIRMTLVATVIGARESPIYFQSISQLGL